MLDNKRNLNISVFLRQFRSYKLEVIEPIRKGDCSHISAEKLRGLIKILPEKEEVGCELLLTHRLHAATNKYQSSRVVLLL